MCFNRCLPLKICYFHFTMIKDAVLTINDPEIKHY